MPVHVQLLDEEITGDRICIECVNEIGRNKNVLLNDMMILFYCLSFNFYFYFFLHHSCFLEFFLFDEIL